MPRTDPRPTRRAFLFAFFGPLFGARLFTPARAAAARFTAIADADLEWLIPYYTKTTLTPV